jgi:hypothetical protein
MQQRPLLDPMPNLAHAGVGVPGGVRLSQYPAPDGHIARWHNTNVNNDTALTQGDRRTFAVTTLGEETNDLQYWLARTPQERLQHIERLRRINYGYRVPGRLQRVLEIVELTSS